MSTFIGVFKIYYYKFELIMDKNIDQVVVANELSVTLSNAHDLLLKISKIASIAGAVFGFIYLLSYTTHVGIPFPFELSVLPTTLLIVGLSSIVGTFIIIAGIFMPALTLDYNDEVTKGYRKADELKDNIIKSRFSRYFFCTWIPTASALVGLILLLGLVDGETWLKPLGGLAICFSLGWMFYTPRYVEVFLENRWPYFFINSLQILFSVCAYLLIIVILISVFTALGKLPAWSGCLIALTIFTLIQVVIFVPSTEKADENILPDLKLKKKSQPAMAVALVLASVCTIFTVLVPQVNYKIGAAALRTFQVGGDLPIVICLKSKPPALISKIFVFDEDYCTEKLSLKLDSGDRFYVSKLSRVKDAIGQPNKSQRETVYFRQDEIRQKIY